MPTDRRLRTFSCHDLVSLTRRILTAGVMLLAAAVAAAQTYATSDELIAAIEARPEPATLQATLQMTVTTASGQSLTREMRMWSSGDTRRVIKFTAPADIAGSGFLSIQHDTGEDETLVYLPALDRVRRIAGGQQGDSFFGSDFAYEDITGFDPADYDHTLTEVRSEDGDWVYLVEATPKPETGSSYERMVLEVPESSLVPERITYYRDGTAAKVLTVERIAEVDGYRVATLRRMETLANGAVSTFTTIAQGDLVLDEAIPDDVFGERFLRR